MVLAAAVTVLVATTVVAVAPVYAAAVTDAGLARRLDAAPPAVVGVEVVARSNVAAADEVAATVTGSLADRLGRVLRPATVTVLGPGFTTGTDELTTDAARAGWLPDHADLVDGSWPGGADGVALPVVLHADAADELAAAVGDPLPLTAAADGRVVDATLVGTYRPRDPEDAVWWGEASLRDGTPAQLDQLTLSPVVTSPAGFAALTDSRQVTLRVRAPIDPEAVGAGDRAATVAGLRAVEDDLAGAGIRGEVRTGLPAELAAAAVAADTTRSTVWITVAQLVTVALLAVALLAGLVTSSRRVEDALLLARGAERRHLVTTALLHGTLVVVPAVLLAPPLAAAVVTASARVGPAAALGLSLRPTVSVGSYVAAAVAGLACLAVLVAPAVRGATFADARASRGRSRGAGVVQRLGLDLVLLVVALVGLWQVRIADGVAVRDLTGRVGADPLLLAAPALGLLAGAVLTVRGVRLLGRALEPLAAGTTTLVPALGGWQLGRRPAQVSQPVVLVVLAVAVATLAGAYGATWSRSQADQAAAAVGADVAAEPDQRGGSALGSHLVGGGIAALPDVVARTAVVEAEASLARGRGIAQVVALDVRSGVGQLRASDRPDPALLTGLHAPDELPGVELPAGATVRGTVTARLLDDVAPRDDTVTVALTVRDGDGLVHRFPDVRTSVAGEEAPVEVPLRTEAGGRPVAVTPPLQLLAVDVAAAPGLAADTDDSPHVEVVVADLRVDDERVDLAATSWEPSEPVLSGSPGVTPAVADVQVDGGTLAVRLLTGVADARSGSTRVRLAPPDAPVAGDPLPALVTRGLLEDTELSVGDTLELRVDGAAVGVRAAGVVDHLPGRPTARSGILVDLPTLAARTYLASGARTAPSAWWIETGPTEEAAEATAAALAARPFLAPRTRTAHALEASLRNDPATAGVLGVLALGALLAGAAAGAAYLAAVGVGARDRRGEVATLRALGTDRREVRRWLTIETVATAGAAAIVGVALGAVLSRLLLPAIALTADGSRGAPDPIWVAPWSTLAAVGVVTVAVCVAAPVVLARQLDRVGIAAELRAGEAGR